MTTNPHIINLNDAIQLTHAFQNAPQYQGNTVACMIDAAAYQQLLAQPGCVNVRTYFALNQGTLTIVVVGVAVDGNDMTNGLILDLAHQCPPKCHFDSPLMQ
jgi:hypothetical protein